MHTAVAILERRADSPRILAYVVTERPSNTAGMLDDPMARAVFTLEQHGRPKIVDGAPIVNGVAVLITAGYANARTMMARLAPPEKMTEFFGLMSLSGTSTTFLGNLAVTAVTALTLSQRGGMMAIMGFLGVGLLLMLFVREERAVAV